MTALVVGATGRTGSAVVRELVQTKKYNAIIAVGHSRAPQFHGEQSVQGIQSPLAELPDAPAVDGFRGIDAIFFCVGTQKRKAGLAAQIKLEVDDTIATAKAAREAGVQLCGIVTCSGANANSVVTYLKSKGRVEQALKALSFPALVIARPGLIIGGDRGPSPTSFTVLALRAINIAMCRFDTLGRALVRKGEEELLQSTRADGGPTRVLILENAQLLTLGQ